MPVLNFSQSDVMAAVTVAKGWYPTMVTEWKAGASKSGKSVNHFVTLQITDGQYKGKEIKILFNSEMNSAQVMGDLSMFPEHDILRMAAAIKNCKLDQLTLENFDTDTLMNIAFDVQFGVETTNGLLFNNITGFAPLGKGSQVAF